MGYGVRQEGGETFLYDLQTTRNAYRVDPSVMEETMARFRGESGPNADPNRPVITTVAFDPLELVDRRENERMAGQVAKFGADGGGLNSREIRALSTSLETHHVQGLVDELEDKRRTVGNAVQMRQHVHRLEDEITEARPAMQEALKQAYKDPIKATKNLAELIDKHGPEAAQTMVRENPSVLGRMNPGEPLTGAANALRRATGRGGLDDSHQREQASIAAMYARAMSEASEKQREPWTAPNGQVYTSPAEKLAAADIAAKQGSREASALEQEIQNRGGIRGARGRAEIAIQELTPAEVKHIQSRLEARERESAEREGRLSRPHDANTPLVPENGDKGDRTRHLADYQERATPDRGSNPQAPDPGPNPQAPQRSKARTGPAGTEDGRKGTGSKDTPGENQDKTTRKDLDKQARSKRPKRLLRSAAETFGKTVRGAHSVQRAAFQAMDGPGG